MQLLWQQAHYDDPDKVAEAMGMMAGAPMHDELETLEVD